MQVEAEISCFRREAAAGLPRQIVTGLMPGWRRKAAATSMSIAGGGSARRAEGRGVRDVHPQPLRRRFPPSNIFSGDFLQDFAGQLGNRRVRQVAKLKPSQQGVTDGAGAIGGINEPVNGTIGDVMAEFRY